jgi:hypothetical protein
MVGTPKHWSCEAMEAIDIWIYVDTSRPCDISGVGRLSVQSDVVCWHHIGLRGPMCDIPHVTLIHILFTDLICQLERDTCLPLIGPCVKFFLCRMSSLGVWFIDLMANGTLGVWELGTLGDLGCYNVWSKKDQRLELRGRTSGIWEFKNPGGLRC